jgi:hypothetical protein
MFFRTWSDREIRTLLARMYPLPLDYNLVINFESIISNCSRLVNLQDVSTATPPAGERYLDSTLVSVFIFTLLLRSILMINY